MPKPPSLAHISPEGKRQPLLQHLQQVARLAADFAQSFGAEEQAYLAGLSHDIGKYSLAFQRRLVGGAKVDHATAGAVECFRQRQPYAAFAVAGHHSGLPDGGGQGDGPEEGTFFGRINRAKLGKLAPYESWQTEITLPQAELPSFTQKDPGVGMFFTRMLYSCLVDADFLDTEAFMTGQKRAPNPADFAVLTDRFDHYISNWFPPKGDLNTERCHILQQCLAQGKTQKPGLFTLTVPTGGGKTSASLAFALFHAKTNQLNRVIYVIPYTSIIEQTARVFREVLGEEQVLEHHSGLLYDLAEEGNTENIRFAQATENWDMPVSVTTAVQFFESLYAYRPSQCRKLHNLAKSVIIFDEAQMLPLPYLRPCVYAIAQLVKHYGTSAVLCTATQPALSPLFQAFLPECPAKELCPADTYQTPPFQRVTFHKAGQVTWAALTQHLQTYAQVLCVVNTRKNAQTVFQQLPKEDRFHLSTLMCPAHRQKTLMEIRRRLQAGLPCRVVSTSLIEAGVDLDFPVVFREEAGLDSILQAAGRCNREGKRLTKDSVVTIFQTEEKAPPLFATAIGIAQQTMRNHEHIASAAAITEYFQQYLEVKGEDAQDQHHILGKIHEELFPFRTVAENFHLIDSPTCTVYLPIDKGAQLIARLRTGEHSLNLFRHLGQYGVSVYASHFQALQAAGALEILADGTAVLTDLRLYSQETGLSLQADTGQALFI